MAIHWSGFLPFPLDIIILVLAIRLHSIIDNERVGEGLAKFLPDDNLKFMQGYPPHQLYFLNGSPVSLKELTERGLSPMNVINTVVIEGNPSQETVRSCCSRQLQTFFVFV